MHRRTLSTCAVAIYLLLCGAAPSQGQDLDLSVSRRPRDTAFSREPSCEQLRAMWIFSRRQSRATEITNDIPTYRDPFAYNVWDAFPRSRSAAGFPAMLSEQVYGRIVHDAPWRLARPRSFPRLDLLAPKTVAKPAPAPRRRLNHRLSGGGVLPLAPISGSFQQLKEMIQNERARELQEQRLAEDAAARAAALQGLPVKTYYGHVVKEPTSQQDTTEAEDKPQHGKNTGVLTFPSLLLPPSSNLKDEHDYLPPGHTFRQNPYSEMDPLAVETALFRQ